MPTLKTTAAVREALPEALKGTLVKSKQDDIWLDYADADLDALTVAASNLTNLKWPVGWDASNLIEAVARAKRASAKAKSKADAAASGDLDPDLKVTLVKLLKGQNVTIKAVLAAYEFLNIEVDKQTLFWVVRVDGHEAPVTSFPAGKKSAPRDYELASIRLPFVYEEPPGARATREVPYIAVRRAIRERIAKALGLDELPEDAEKAKAWRMEHGFEAPARPKERRNGDWTCGFCWQVHAVDGNGRLVHHGYRRPGVGYIIGDCQGVGELPWERSNEGAKWALEGAMARSELTTDRVRKGCFRLDVQERNPTTGKTETVWIFPDDPRWPEADRKQREADARILRALWSNWFCSVPWLRAALREWKYEEMGAVGAPNPNILPEDSADRPAEAA